MSTTDSFTISRAEFYRRWDGKVHNEHIDTYDRYDWNGRRYRRFLSIPGIAVRWDNGDPGDEHDGD